MKTQIFASAAVAATMLVSTSALAQPAPAAQPQAQATAGTGMGLPGPQAAAVAGDSDHDMMVGSFAIGYLGRRTVPFGTGSQAPTSPNPGAGRAETPAPIIGARYWVTPLIGIDAGLGFSMLGDGKNKTEGPGISVEEEPAPVTAFLFHAGVPLALSNTGHFSFQVIPEFNVGFATQTVDSPGAVGVAGIEDKGSGMFFDVGARGGAEIHFGFIGVPQLALQGSIGLLYRFEKWQMESTEASGTYKYSETRGAFTTTVYDNPWNIFTSNVSALYYF